MNEHGFTFAELLAVVLLLGVLVLTALPDYLGVGGDTRRNVDAATIRGINAALALYAARTGSCPPIGGFAAFLNDPAYFPDGAPTDPWTNPPSSAPYIATYSAVLCRVQMSILAPSPVDHGTGLGH